MNEVATVSAEVLTALAALADRADAETIWPTGSWDQVTRAGVLGWSVPQEFGGNELSPRDLLERHEQLAGACLTTTFLLSQREAAVRRIIGCANESLRSRLLPRLSAGDIFATVGLSQLTTSRQHASPALTACREPNGWTLRGVIPWVTGADHSDYLVTGAVQSDGRKVLLVVPRETPGLIVQPALDLMALRGSLTTEVVCNDVSVSEDWLLQGPTEGGIAGRRGGTGGLETSCLALGLAGAAIVFLGNEAAARPDLKNTWEKLASARDRLRRELHALCGPPTSAAAAAQLRAKANRLVLGATQAALTAAKGAGFLRSHPAQRWARQALFFLVWSCPRPAAEATLTHLASE
jgi:alkylation response protein AidB-like acyl-CoA dehydrogenase